MDVIFVVYCDFFEGVVDDVELVLCVGYLVIVMVGEDDNLKLIWFGDFDCVECILGGVMDICFGNGFDVYVFIEGDYVWLCGVWIVYDKVLLGYFDVDVGMYVLIDVIYGVLV